MLDVGRLRLLLAISEHGGTAGAARALGRPEAEVFGQVSDVSREIGLTLLDGNSLTPAGRRLAEHGGRLLGQLEAAESDAAAVAGRLAGTLRIGVGAAAGRVLLADALPALRSAAPELSVHVRQLADEQVGALGSTLDAVVVGEYGTAVPHRADAAVERRELLTEPLLLAVPSRHRATGASVRLAELAGESWVGGAGDALLALERAAAGAGFAPRLVAEVGEDALALTLVAAGLGVALVPASAAPAPVDGVRFLTVLDGGLRRTVVAAVRRSAVADPGVRRLLDALAAAARRVAAAVPGVSAAPAGPPSPAGPGGSSRPDPLLDPLPDAPSPRNGRRDPWPDRVRPDSPFGTDLGGGRNGGPADLPGRNGTPRPDLPARNGSADPLGSSDLPGLPGRNGFGGPGEGAGSNGTPGDRRGRPDPLGSPGDQPGRNGVGPEQSRGGATRFSPPGSPEPHRRRRRAEEPEQESGSLPAPGGQSDRPGSGGPAATGDQLPRSGHDLSHRGGTSSFGPADLSGPGALPAPGGDLPSRGAPNAQPGRGPADFGALPPAGGDLGPRPPTGDLPVDFGSLPRAAGDRPADLGALPPAGDDRPGQRPADFGSLPPVDERSRQRPADFGALPPASGSDFGTLPPARGDQPGRGDRPDRSDVGSLPPAGDRNEFGSLPLAGDRNEYGSLPPAGGRGDRPGALPPAGSKPGALPGPGTGRGASRFEAPPADGPVLPPPGLPAPGGELPSRGGSSPYRTPPPTGDLPPAEMPRFGTELGPNPYRPDPSAHPAPDPFRAGGPDQGPNPYRSNGRRGDSLGGVELFSASDRPGMPDGPPAPRSGGAPHRRSRAAARGGDGAEGNLPPAPAGTPDVRLSIFEDLQSEWFVQRDGQDTAAPKNPSWQMAADDGWAAAARLAEPTTAGTTTAGLPRRRPQAMAVPGAVGGPVGSEGPPPSTTHRSPQEVRGRLSSYRDGVRRGRHAERTDAEEQ